MGHSYICRLLCLVVAFVVASSAEELKELPAYWKALNKRELDASLDIKENVGLAKNVIFCLGDGMGLPTINAMRMYKQELAGRAEAMDDLFFETFPYTGLLKAYTTTYSTADSAATATAYMTGVRAASYAVNVDDHVEYGNCSSYEPEYAHTPITKLAKLAGMSVGMVTTTRITHATPATSYGNSPSRWWEKDADVPLDSRRKCHDLARQFVEKGEHIDVMLGGGRSLMLPSTQSDPEHTKKNGLREDGRNLINEWISGKEKKGLNCSYVYKESEFARIDPQRTDCLLGLFEYDHMNYEADRSKDVAGEPSLTDMVEKTIKILEKNPRGFFLFLEGGRIDHGHHDGRAKYAVTDGLEFERAIQKAVAMTKASETLTIVTADHSHAMHVVGYKRRRTPLFALSDSIGSDDMPFTTLLYSIGPGYNETGRQNLTGVDTEAYAYRQQSAVPKKKVNHSGEDVSVYASGPWAHLVRRLSEQTYVNEVMLYAACLREYGLTRRCVEYKRNAASSRFDGSRLTLSATTTASLVVVLALVY